MHGNEALLDQMSERAGSYLCRLKFPANRCTSSLYLPGPDQSNDRRRPPFDTLNTGASRLPARTEALTLPQSFASPTAMFTSPALLLMSLFPWMRPTASAPAVNRMR